MLLLNDFECAVWKFFEIRRPLAVRGSAPRSYVVPACACWRGIFACWRGISRAIELLFFMDSKGNVRRVFLACVLHALGWNPAGARVFRNCASKGHLPMVLLG